MNRWPGAFSEESSSSSNDFEIGEESDEFGVGQEIGQRLNHLP